MRILITGGFGFVGGRLAQYLQSVGHEIVLGSRAIEKAPDWLSGVEIVNTVWVDDSVLQAICTPMDVVIHAAGMNAMDCAADPVAALGFNGLASARLAQAAAKVGIKRFIYFSTAHVYAAPLAGNIHEDICPINRHPYATSHLAGENAVLEAGARHGMNALVLRLSNVFGRPVHASVNCWMLLVNDLCRQAVTTRELKLKTSGSQQRDFIPMSEVCKVVSLLVTEEKKVVPFNVFNLGVGASVSVLQMAERIRSQCQRSLGFEPTLVFPEPTTHKAAERLSYRIDRLQRLQISVNSDPDTELDELLRFCHSQF